jgi:hypothetical protein
MNTLNKVGFISLATLATLEQSFAAITTWGVDARLEGRTDDLPTAIQSLMSYATNFLYLIAVGFALYGGFQILTAGGEDDKVKSGKKILINAVLGLFVIFIAASVIKFVVKALIQ